MSINAPWRSAFNSDQQSASRSLTFRSRTREVLILRETFNDLIKNGISPETIALRRPPRVPRQQTPPGNNALSFPILSSLILSQSPTYQIRYSGAHIGAAFAACGAQSPNLVLTSTQLGRPRLTKSHPIVPSSNLGHPPLNAFITRGSSSRHQRNALHECIGSGYPATISDLGRGSE